MEELMPLPRVILQPMVENALLEDLGERGDITSLALIDSDVLTELNIIAREAGVICGLELMYLAFKLIDKNIEINYLVNDGDRVEAKTIIATVSGRAQALLTAERTALNFLTLLSGIATQTRSIVDEIQDFPAQITCTRKTIPNLRAIQKYAVRCGGAINHRMNLSDAILIKDNHIAIVGGISEAIRRAKLIAGHNIPIEVEIDNLNQLEKALFEGIQLVLLDNMDYPTMKQAVKMCQGKARTEASGGITLKTVKDVARTGVDFIAIGALTHSFKSLDIGLDYLSDESNDKTSAVSHWFKFFKK
ncbi:MAG: carboxylating nicotinate-nucleotide diphosphorylase [Neisseriaceae bacterium]|nr:carboxylating nicotinate-nucleotide diphosphorylase [Neisseriaceae bacterium PsAf]MCV2503370.1 carboxylating nicotinate-nucleotide diphosphorylase [Neisseriaceae bacterium]MCV2508862.1 carboxylating nicotinate-nucleotide diphosphorylase [Neisseriaceae bacterium]